MWPTPARTARHNDTCPGTICVHSDTDGEDTGRTCPESGRRHDRSDSRSSEYTSDSRSEQEPGKDEIVHFSWHKGMVLHSRYEMVRLLGDGTFGRVLLAQDRREDRQVAIKVIRDIKRYMESARIEADILKDICRADPQGASRYELLKGTQNTHSLAAATVNEFLCAFAVRCFQSNTNKVYQHLVLLGRA